MTEAKVVYRIMNFYNTFELKLNEIHEMVIDKEKQQQKSANHTLSRTPATNFMSYIHPYYTKHMHNSRIFNKQTNKKN